MRARVASLAFAVVAGAVATMLPPDPARSAAPSPTSSADPAAIARLMREERYAEAIPLAEREVETRRRLFGDRRVELARALDTLARLEYEQGLLESAESHERESLAIREERLGKGHLEVAESLEQLGRIVKVLGTRGDLAMTCYQRAFDIRVAVLGPTHPDVARLWVRMANIHRLYARYSEAIPLFQQAIAVRRRAFGNMDHEVGVWLADLALTITAMGDWERAEPYAREALAIQSAAPLKREQDYSMCLNLNAQILSRRGQYATAESLLTRSARLREEQRQRSVPGVGRARMFPLLVYLELAAVQLAQHEDEAAWNSLEKSLARGLCDSRRGGRASARRFGLAAAVVTTGADDPPLVTPLPLARVQAALEPGVAMIGWFETRRGGSRVVASRWGYVIRNRGPIHWERIDVDPAAEARYVARSTRYLHELRAAGSWPLRVTDLAAAKALARNPYDRNLGPLASWLGGARQLVVISSDASAGVPVESWADPRGRYMTERFIVSYAPSAAWYVRLHQRDDRRSPDRWRALLVGDPALSSPPSREATTPERDADAIYSPLPRARAEVMHVGTLLPRADVLLGSKASEQAMERLARRGELSHFDLVHIATHAVVDDRDPGRSALLLADERGGDAAPTVPRTEAIGATDRARMDGRLTADEIRGWRLDAELVSLSACRTGLGFPTRTEGFLGLNQAILSAGAHSLLVSLWDVDDTAQSMLADRFYENLAGKTSGRPMTKAAALAEAKAWLRNYRDASGHRPFAHPAYWAAFVLIGDPT